MIWKSPAWFWGGIGKDKSGRGFYGDKIELWAKDGDDIGIAERYMEQLAEDRNRGSMAWKCWQIGGYRCGNITRQAFDAARREYHWLDLLWGGFPGADAPSIGTGKTMWERKSYYGDCPQRRGNCMRGLVGGKHLPFYDANLIRDAATQVVPFRLMATGR